jgi:hypothetical protein
MIVYYEYWPITAVGAEQIESNHRDEICLLDPILEELAREGRIRINASKHGNWISLKE